MELVVDNRRVFGATGGRNLEQGKPLVILIHGAGQDRTIWVLQTRYLAHHGFSVLAIDLPGHGRSEGPPLTSIEAMSDWTARLVEATGFETAALVGHSMGAFVALQCAADHSDRIDRIALVSVAAEMPVHPEMLAAAEAGEQRAIDLMVGWSHSPAGHRGGHQQPGIWMLGASKRVIERTAPGVLSADFTACTDRGSLVDIARRIDLPVSLLLGGNDKMTMHVSGVELASEIRDASVLVLPNAGHSILSEEPDVVAKDLARFLAGSS